MAAASVGCDSSTHRSMWNNNIFVQFKINKTFWNQMYSRKKKNVEIFVQRYKSKVESIQNNSVPTEENIFLLHYLYDWGRLDKKLLIYLWF